MNEETYEILDFLNKEDLIMYLGSRQKLAEDFVNGLYEEKMASCISYPRVVHAIVEVSPLN